MRSIEDACAAWKHFSTFETFEDLQRSVSGRQEKRLTTPLDRSAVWKACLVLNTLDHSQWPMFLRDSRQTYSSLRHRFLSGISDPNETDTIIDPLSDTTNSPWDALRDDETAREEILLDVDRCMPENHFFRQPETQNILLDVLFVWAKLNPDVGYRQGMHEILAPILWVVECDAIDAASVLSPTGDHNNERLAREVFDAEFVAHDSFTIFVAVMRNLKSCYESSGQNASRTEEPAMTTRSKRVVSHLLAAVDPPLAQHLQKLDIAPQIFLMRWMRLLFGREFAFDDVLAMWDLLFVQDDSLECVDLVCVAMLLRIRWQLIEADYNTALALLLRYPPLQPQHPPRTLVHDAAYLKSHLDFDGGARLITKHTGKSPAPTGRPIPESGLQSPKTSMRTSSKAARTTQRQQSPSPNLESLIQNAAKGVLSRGEKWGVNKAVRDAVGEVRKNVPVLQNSLSGLAQDEGTRASNLRTAATDEAGRHALDRVIALEERNKSLATMLEGALEQLWKQQSEAVNLKTSEDESVKQFSMAIAKVQLTQVYLADSSLPLPRDEGQVQSEDGPDQAQGSRVKDRSGDDSDAATKPERSTIQSTQKPRDAPRLTQQRTRPPKQQAQHQPGDPGGSNRPSLEHSSFSWMLGQEEKAAKAPQTLETRPTAAHRRNESDIRRKNVGFLFGDNEEVEDPPRRGSAAEKGRQKPRLTDDDEGSDAFRMGTMNG